MEDFNSKYSGEQVEALLDQVASGNVGGGGIVKETDPVFSASAAATITEQKIAEWDAKSAQGEKGDKGDTGVGVQSVTQTTTSNADGGSNVVTVTLTDGSKSTFTVNNGSKGSSGSNGANGKDGADGENGATFTPSVDSAGNLSWTNNKGLTNPPTVNIKGPKGDAGEGGGDVVNTPRYIQWDYTQLAFSGPEPMTPNVTYICTRPIDMIHLDAFLDPGDSWHGGVTDLYNEYSIIFESDNVNITTPDYFIWANGAMPTIENGVRYELSIALMYINNNYIAHAVLTPFKPV